MSYFDEKELLEKRGRIIDKQEKLLQEASDEGRELNDEEQKRFDNMEEEYSRLTQQIENTRKLREKKDATEDRLGEKAEKLSFQEGEKKVADEVREEEELHSRAFWNYVRAENGIGDLSPEEREYMSQIRAQSTTDSAGGYTVPEGFSNELETALKRFGGMRQAARVISTDRGNDLPWPTNDDTGNVGEILGENTQVNEQDTTFGVVTFKAWKYSSKAIRVSVEILQDSAFDMEGYLAERLAERVGRITNTHFTTGDDSSKPAGVVPEATVGKTTSAADDFTFQEVIDLKHAVDPAYRGLPSSQYMFSDATLAAIKKKSVGSSDARPLWQPSFVVGEPDRVDGSSYVINQDVADSGTAANKFMLYGDFSKYIIRDVRSFELLVLRERYADFHQVGIFGFLRTDGRMIDAGQNPIQVMQHAAS